jgi:hypothetical protein
MFNYIYFKILTTYFYVEQILTLQMLNQDILMCTREEEWGNALLRNNVILRDRLMTDAALGGPRPPIKYEHSYSLSASSPPPSPATPGANPHTPNSGSGAVGFATATASSSIDFANLDHRSLDIRDRIDGKRKRHCATQSFLRTKVDSFIARLSHEFCIIVFLFFRNQYLRDTV